MAFYGYTDNPYDEQREAPGFTCEDLGCKWVETPNQTQCEHPGCEVQMCEQCRTACTTCGVDVCQRHRRTVDLKPFCLECAEEQNGRTAA